MARRALGAMLVLMISLAPTAYADWADLWQRPSQRAGEWLENGEIDRLVEEGPGDDWRGLGAYARGDHAAAARHFRLDGVASNPASLDDPELVLDDEELDRVYNRATTETQLGNYQEARRLFDAVLSRDPERLDAQRNRAIADALAELDNEPGSPGDERTPDSRGNTQGSDPQINESAEADASDSEGAEPDADAPGSDPKVNDSAQANQSSMGEDPGSDPGIHDSAEADPGETAGEQSAAGEVAELDDEAEQQAREAMATAGGENPSDGVDTPTANAAHGGASDVPLGEAEQAIEQWLRQIPDDPRGLLRRKLEQTHRRAYPEVGSAPRPW